MKVLWENRVLKAFLTWRVALFMAALIATLILPFKNSFPYWNLELIPTHLPPWVWGFGNFDGVHYLRLARMGYSSEYTQAFFPVFPLLIYLFSFGQYFFISGLLAANLSFLIALCFLYQLFKLDFSERISFRGILLLLAFPTAFYFGAVYSESTFLLLSVLTIFFARKKNFWAAGIFAAVASATRIIGIVLWLVILIEIYQNLKDRKLSMVFAALVPPVGLIAYMIYLKFTFNNPFYFFTAQNSFGLSRSTNLVLLPQVLIRYLRIFLSVPVNSYPFFNAFLEFIFTVIPIGFLIVYFRRIRLSYLVFILACLVTPTFTGTFLSMPRFALMIFPVLPILAQMKERSFKIIMVSFIMAQIVFLSLFIRGYWIA